MQAKIIGHASHTWNRVELPSGEIILMSHSEKSVNVFSEDGEIIAWFGETYNAPMTAQNTRRTEKIQVKKGQAFASFNSRGMKEILSHPEMVEIPIV